MKNAFFFLKLLNTATLVCTCYLGKSAGFWKCSNFYWSKVFFTGCMTQSESKKTVRWHKPSAQWETRWLCWMMARDGHWQLPCGDKENLATLSCSVCCMESVNGPLWPVRNGTLWGDWLGLWWGGHGIFKACTLTSQHKCSQVPHSSSTNRTWPLDLQSSTLAHRPWTSRIFQTNICLTCQYIKLKHDCKWRMAQTVHNFKSVATISHDTLHKKPARIPQ